MKGAEGLRGQAGGLPAVPTGTKCVKGCADCRCLHMAPTSVDTMDALCEPRWRIGRKWPRSDDFDGSCNFLSFRLRH